MKIKSIFGVLAAFGALLYADKKLGWKIQDRVVSTIDKGIEKITLKDNKNTEAAEEAAE